MDMSQVRWVFLMVGGGVSIHDTRVTNNVPLLSLEVTDEEMPLQISFVF